MIKYNYEIQDDFVVCLFPAKRCRLLSNTQLLK